MAPADTAAAAFREERETVENMIGPVKVPRTHDASTHSFSEKKIGEGI